MENNRKIILKSLPKVDRLFKDPRIKVFVDRYPKKMIIEEIRSYLKKTRASILNNDEEVRIDYDTIVKGLVAHAEYGLETSLKRAVNGLGVILHTGLGRAPYSAEAQRALVDVIANYCTLQIGQESGRRGDRYAHVEKLLCQITGAEAAIVVNNNAAATLLILNTLSEGKEVITSRGELVEIGGAFRIPDVMRRSGAILREVGTTNRTHLKDYAEAINEETGLVLQVHMSNYAIIGFTKIVPLADLAELSHRNGLPLFHDLGSGALVDLSRWGLSREPTVQDSIRDNADIICFSGDKLLGGPQSGIIVGKSECVEKMKKNQLSRALRCDKMTYAVLEATLRHFMDERALTTSHPVTKMLTESESLVKKRCMGMKRRIKTTVGDRVQLRIVADTSEVGSGSLASAQIPSWAVGIRTKEMPPDVLAERLRLCNPPIFGRVQEDRYLLNCRTIRDDEVRFILKALENVFGIGI